MAPPPPPPPPPHKKKKKKTSTHFWVNQGFFFSQKPGFVTFLTLWPPNFMQKMRKSWWAKSEILHCERTNGRIVCSFVYEQSQIHEPFPWARVQLSKYIIWVLCFAFPFSRFCSVIINQWLYILTTCVNRSCENVF